MTTLLVAAFLAIHGLLHLAVWLPHPEPAADRPPPPFEPAHSALLTATATVSATTTRRLAVILAAAAAAAYLLAAVGVALALTGLTAIAVGAAALGLALKLLFFHPWLLMGLGLDTGVLLAALTGWPVALG